MLFLNSARVLASFWLNFFSFRTETEVSGFVFESLIVVQDDTVTYKLWEGNPTVLKRSRKTQPLGPLNDVDMSIRLSFP